VRASYSGGEDPVSDVTAAGDVIAAETMLIPG
jgi:hypothetical protein